MVVPRKYPQDLSCGVGAKLLRLYLSFLFVLTTLFIVSTTYLIGFL